MKISQWIGLFFFWIVTQRIPFVKYDSNGTFFQQIWHKQLNFFEYDSKIWIFFKKNKRLTEFNPLSSNMTKELAFFLEYDAQNWTFKKKICLELNLFFFKIRLKHLNTFWKYDSKNSTLYFWLDSKYWTFYFEYGSKNWTLFYVTQRMFFFFKKKKRLKELKPFLKNKTWLKELEFFDNYFKKWGSFEYDSNIFFYKIDSQNWTFFFYKCDSKKLNFFFRTLLEELNPFSLRLKELNPFFLIRLWDLNPFFNTTQKLTQQIWLGILFFKYDSKNCFFEYDSTNWTFFRMTPSTQLLFSKWLKKLNFIQKNDSKNWIFFEMTQRNWTLIFYIWLKELNFFIRLKELNFFSQFRLKELNFLRYDPNNWTFFRLKELNFFSVWHSWSTFLKNMTHRIELFFITTHRN